METCSFIIDGEEKIFYGDWSPFWDVWQFTLETPIEYYENFPVNNADLLAEEKEGEEEVYEIFGWMSKFYGSFVSLNEKEEEEEEEEEDEINLNGILEIIEFPLTDENYLSDESVHSQYESSEELFEEFCWE